MTTQQTDELIEQLAAIEHTRWAEWQQWVHDQARRDWNADGDPVFTFTVDQIQRWQKQIETEYSELTEAEKQSDRDQVMHYWPLLATEQRRLIKRIEEALPPKEVVYINNLTVRQVLEKARRSL